MDVSGGGYFYDVAWLRGPLVVMGFPWLLLVLYVIYYLLKRPREVAVSTIAPFALFMRYLTDGATAGYDRPLMSLFHPSLLENNIDRGLMRAMVRCVCKRLGGVVHIPRDTVLVKSRGNDVSLAALVDFQHARRVKCRLSWAWSPSGGVISTKDGPVRRFHVTGFHVEPPAQGAFDVLNFLSTEDFLPFAELFVERLFERPPRGAVMMMAPALRERQLAKLEEMQRCVQRVCGASGGTPRDVNATLVRERILRASLSEKRPQETVEGAGDNSDNSDNSDDDKSDGAAGVRGIEMCFLVTGVGLREAEVTVVLAFVDLRCYVSRYEVRGRPDTRTQVVLDYDTGEKTIVA